ncbi:hypothetical protein F5Y05DRAFT_407455 [Hypoxylon sp. FL0543]|nr:hypothetical protein F5Y05DRAFT_407455 [Hypoxylon sp. FL0543]
MASGGSMVENMLDINAHFDELFVLIDGGHIKPIHQITTFRSDEAQKALAYIRSGKDLDQIVISNGERDNIQVPIRPAIRGLQLRPNVSYLIVGGLKGACGKSAIHRAQFGARNLIISSSSGISVEASEKTVASCDFYSCKVTDAKGVVGNIESVRQLFKFASPRIASVIQGLMWDGPFEMMTLDDYHTAIHAKVQGTWTIHWASQELQKQPLDFLPCFRTLSLRGNTVVIEDVDYVAEARFYKRQWTQVDDTMLRKLFAHSILQQISTPAKAERPRFSYLFNSRGGSKIGSLEHGDEKIKLNKSGADLAALKLICVEVVSAEFAKILR